MRREKVTERGGRLLEVRGGEWRRGGGEQGVENRRAGREKKRKGWDGMGKDRRGRVEERGEGERKVGECS